MEYAINNYRWRKVSGKYFVTTDSGSWAVLEPSEFQSLRQNNIGKELYEKLAKSEIAIDDTNYDEYARDLRKRNSFLFSGASLHIVVVTLRCNMKCVYCHASSVDESKKESDMDIKTAKNTVDFIFQSPSHYISIEFQGGEPLLNFDVIKYIVEYSEKKNSELKKDLMFSVVTNMTTLDDGKMDYLIRHNVNICTSLDGPKEVHDKNRIYSCGSNHDIVVSWMKKINDEYKKRGIEKSVSALVTLTRHSLKFPDEIVDEYASLGIKRIHLRYLQDLGVASTAWKTISYSPDEYLEFWKKAMERIKFWNIKGKIISERVVDEIIVPKIASKFDPGYLDLRSPCGASIGQITYNFDGKIYTCDEARSTGDETFVIGDVNTTSYKEAVTCDKACAVTEASVNDQYICDSCAYKPYCGVCPVCSFAERGSLITDIPSSARCRIFKAQFDWTVSERFIRKTGEIKSLKESD